ncbi:hypothetical protein A1O1_05379 [Capronia coronata CBS 617.96]|uniref:Alpha/beta hydrolase fold-3 domain-containing protein n=1 Tax=Capronia coronata CBS 617.96 TaxID=1182541 RepID=W9Z1R6_9EURO|nr:uncharacterized protein A1O1_05379 [Capronia coronata CBS 617.96]EXJ88449.1 hypothetical protein A1O1_05379 [Capronia coronata CBS 617.96]
MVKVKVKVNPDDPRKPSRKETASPRLGDSDEGVSRPEPAGDDISSQVNDYSQHRQRRGSDPVTEPDSESKSDHRDAQDVDIEITLVSHPLAPASPASETLPALRRWLSQILDDAAAQGDAVTLMGDSSGGNLAPSLGFWAVENYHATTSTDNNPDRVRTHQAEQTDQDVNFPLASLICISPPVDMRNINPCISESNKHDPVLTMELTSRVARDWTADTTPSSPSTKASSVSAAPRMFVPFSAEDPSTSPLLIPVSAFHMLKQRGVASHGVIGTHDVLAPDALEFMRRCESLEVVGRWLVWEGHMHCFPLACGWRRLGLRQGREGRGFVVSLLKDDAAGC